MNAKTLAQFPRRKSNDEPSQPIARRPGREPLAAATAPPDADALAVQFLRSFHLLLRSVRLYHQHHTRLIGTIKSEGVSHMAVLSLSTELIFGTHFVSLA